MKAFCIDVKFRTSVCNCFVQSFLADEQLICLVHFSDQFLIRILHSTKAVVAIEAGEANEIEMPQVQHAIETHLQNMLCKGRGKSGPLSLA
ncbi:MAG: hypothetical protein J0I41_10870 [Filimonas sp.]|nr:hypothetical protein [Filimonas sp.]